MQIRKPASRMWKIVRGTTKHARIVKTMHERQDIHDRMKIWADEVMGHLDLRIDVKGKMETDRATLLVGNHLSYLDIPLLMWIGPVRFIAKHQIGKWPVFGKAMRTIDTFLVDRDDPDSRKSVAEQVGKRMVEKNQIIAVFPSGTTSLGELKPWRWGALEIARLNDIPIQPFRLRYTPARLAAFIDDDAFVPHLWRVLSSDTIHAAIEFHEPVKVTDSKAQAEYWQRWTQEFLT